MATRHGHHEAHYLYAARVCHEQRIFIYPIPNRGGYNIEIDYDGWLWESYEKYKEKPRWKKDKYWVKETWKLYQLIYILNRMEKPKNILEEVAEIIYNRDSEKAKDYGPFHESMKDAAKIMTILTGKHITGLDFYKGMMALKLARLRYSNKKDTYLDLLAYIASASELKDDIDVNQLEITFEKL